MVKLGVNDKKYLAALGLMSALCLAFLAFRIISTHTIHYYFVAENLALAWLPLLFAWLLARNLLHKRWLSWQNLALSLLWLSFLPNAWYVLTDFVHLQPTDEIDILFDICMIGSLVFTGFILGFTSLYIVHTELLKRFRRWPSHTLIALAILLSSFAIYLGRDLRWSSWDIITNPSGILLNISDRVVNPLGYRHTGSVTAMFFVLLSTLYASIWLFFHPLRVFRARKPSKSELLS